MGWCSQWQATMALLSTEVKYVILTFTAKKATWMRLLLTKVGLLDKKGQYAEIKVVQRSKKVKQIKANVTRQEQEAYSRKESLLTNNAVASLSAPPFQSFLSSDISATLISLKEDYWRSIALAHNSVFHARIKHIDI